MSARDDLKVLQAVEKRHGLLTADFLIADATNPRHPWHNRFTWDDTSAARKWRVHEARELIRAVRYQVVEDEQIYRSSAYVRDPAAEASSQGYAPVARLRGESERARDVLLTEFSRVAAALRRARDVSGTLGLNAEVDNVIITIEGLSGIVSHMRSPARRKPWPSDDGDVVGQGAEGSGQADLVGSDAIWHGPAGQGQAGPGEADTAR
jgi:hypothetical protein